MKIKFILALAVGALLLAGCATHGSHSMACGKCSCKMMQASAADAHKCAMCGHTDAEHNEISEGKTGSSEHQH